MKLPDINLADRTYEQLVTEAKSLISRNYPAWTDYNASDPGITLLELFAYLIEGSLNKMNDVSEKSYENFTKLLGVTKNDDELIEELLRNASKTLTDKRAITVGDFESIAVNYTKNNKYIVKRAKAEVIKLEYKAKVNNGLENERYIEAIILPSLEEFEEELFKQYKKNPSQEYIKKYFTEYINGLFDVNIKTLFGKDKENLTENDIKDLSEQDMSILFDKYKNNLSEEYKSKESEDDMFKLFVQDIKILLEYRTNPSANNNSLSKDYLNNLSENYIKEIFEANKKKIYEDGRQKLLEYNNSICEEVYNELKKNSLITTKIKVKVAEYQEIMINIKVSIDNSSYYDKQNIINDVCNSIKAFINPLSGGLNNMGWTFGRSLYRSELLSVISNVDGVDYVEQLYMCKVTEDIKKWVAQKISFEDILKKMKEEDRKAAKGADRVVLDPGKSFFQEPNVVCEISEKYQI